MHFRAHCITVIHEFSPNNEYIILQEVCCVFYFKDNTLYTMYVMNKK